MARAAKEKALDRIRTTSSLTPAPNISGRRQGGNRLDQCAPAQTAQLRLDLNWLPVPVLPKKQWPAISFRTKRGITLTNTSALWPPKQSGALRVLCPGWHLGGAVRPRRVDGGEHRLDKPARIRFFRKKTHQRGRAALQRRRGGTLRGLPQHGLLFPNFSQIRETHRATEFKRACHRLGICGVTLHSYRYAWAERAKMCGYPERFAQTALGHNSRAVHEAYAGAAVPVCPPLDDYEREMEAKMVPMQAARSAAPESLAPQV